MVNCSAESNCGSCQLLQCLFTKGINAIWKISFLKFKSWLKIVVVARQSEFPETSVLQTKRIFLASLKAACVCFALHEYDGEYFLEYFFVF